MISKLLVDFQTQWIFLIVFFSPRSCCFLSRLQQVGKIIGFTWGQRLGGWSHPDRDMMKTWKGAEIVRVRSGTWLWVILLLLPPQILPLELTERERRQPPTVTGSPAASAPSPRIGSLSGASPRTHGSLLGYSDLSEPPGTGRESRWRFSLLPSLCIHISSSRIFVLLEAAAVSISTDGCCLWVLFLSFASSYWTQRRFPWAFFFRSVCDWFTFFFLS